MTGDPGFEARNHVRRSVAQMTGNLGDPPSAAHDPLKALGALAWLRVAVSGAEREAARKAREDGQLWSGIGEALGFADRPEPGMTSVAEHAFGRFASDLGSGPSFAWRCPSCGGLVADHGPELGNPHDAERGHAEGCERFAATVRAWDAQWDDDERG